VLGISAYANPTDPIRAFTSCLIPYWPFSLSRQPRMSIVQEVRDAQQLGTEQLKFCGGTSSLWCAPRARECGYCCLSASVSIPSVSPVCDECLIGKQNKPILFEVTEPSSVPYRTPSACANRAAYLDPPPVIPLPDTCHGRRAKRTSVSSNLKPPTLVRPEIYTQAPVTSTNCSQLTVTGLDKPHIVQNFRFALSVVF
jgi:hypothetical protein